jgi:hypothetical protein
MRAKLLRGPSVLWPRPQQHKDHQHARFDNLGVDGQGAMESVFSLFVIFRAAESLERLD